MKLHFYGTAASEGVPALFCACESCRRIRKLGPGAFRSRTSCQVDEDLLIDFSADTFDHMRYGGLDLTKIRALLLTHAHPDHFYPADLVRTDAPNAYPETRPVLEVWGSASAAAGLAAQWVPETLRHLRMHPITFGDGGQAGSFSFRALPANHAKDQECFLYLLKKEGKSLLYAHDTAYFPEETWRALAGEKLDCVVLDCTCCNAPSQFEGHMGFPENRRVQERMLREGIVSEQTRFVATHFFHRGNPVQEELEAAFAPYGFLAAYDGMELTF